MPKIFLIKNRLLQQQARLLETSKESSEITELEPIERELVSQPLNLKQIYEKLENSVQSPSPRPPQVHPDSDIDNDSDEPLSLVVNKSKSHNNMFTSLSFCNYCLLPIHFIFHINFGVHS